MKDLITEFERLTVRLVHENMTKRGETKQTLKQYRKVINEMEKRLGLEIDELYNELMK